MMTALSSEMVLPTSPSRPSARTFTTLAISFSKPSNACGAPSAADKPCTVMSSTTTLKEISVAMSSPAATAKSQVLRVQSWKPVVAFAPPPNSVE